MKKTLLNFQNKTLAFLFMLTLIVPILTLHPQLVEAGTNQCTWTGGGADNNWSTAANWGCSVGSVPATGYDIIFSYLGSSETPVNDLLASNTYASMWFTGSPPAGYLSETPYSISGNTIQLAGDINSQMVDGDGRTLRILAGVTFTSPATIDTNPGTNNSTLAFSGTVNTGVNTLNTISGNNAGAKLLLYGDLAGSGDLSMVGDVYLALATTNFTGNITVTGGLLEAVGDSYGDTTGNTTVGANGSLLIGDCAANITIAENIIFTGAAASGNSAKLLTEAGCGGGFFDDWFTSAYTNYTITLSGDITLNTNIEVAPMHYLVLTGNVLGPTYTLTMAYDAAAAAVSPFSVFGGSLDLTLTISNTTNTVAGVYRNPVFSRSVSDSMPGNTVGIGSLNEVTITGTRGDVSVYDGGILKGTGTVANVTSTGGVLQPGLSPGVLTTSNLLFDGATTVDMELGGTLAGEFDQFAVTGTVTLGNATLNTILYNGYVPANIGDSYTIINNDGVDAVTGTFNGIAEGGSVNVGAYRFDVSYVGGDGNDVVLTASYIPGPPGTGFGVIKNSYLMPILLAVISTILLAGMYEWKKSLRKRFARR